MQLPIDSDLFGSAGTDDAEVPAVKTNRREPEAFAAADQSVSDQIPVSRTGANVQRVVLFYDDQTFESFTPTKR